MGRQADSFWEWGEEKREHSILKWYIRYRGEGRLSTPVSVAGQALAAPKNQDLAVSENWCKMTQLVRKSKSFLVQTRPPVPRWYFNSIEEIWSKWEADRFRNLIGFYLLVFLNSSEKFPPKHGQLQVRKYIWPWGAFVDFQEFWAEIWVWSLEEVGPTVQTSVISQTYGLKILLFLRVWRCACVCGCTPPHTHKCMALF